ncbi:MAG: S-layer homology domain-containing protein, partial [Candidatus Ornithomonoglobus sp.]
RSGIVDELAGYDPEMDEMILSVTQGAGGWMIDNVSIQIPYTTAKILDTAVSDWSKLSDVAKVSVLYGDEIIGETKVTWDIPDENDNIVYGTTELDGIRAKAIKASVVKKLKADGKTVTAEDVTLSYGMRAAADGDNQLVVFIDNFENMNALSAVSSTGIYAEPASGTTDAVKAMKVSDNGNGICVEGTIPDYAGNNECIVITDGNDVPAAIGYAAIGADGKYSVNISGLSNGSYRAAMTNTGAYADFSYADAASFEALCKKVRNGESVSALISGADAEMNRAIIGAEYFDVYNKLTAAAQADICNLFKAELLKSGETRAAASAALDRLIVMNSAASSLSISEWKQLLDDNAAVTGISGTNAYSVLGGMTDQKLASVKSKLAAKSVTEQGFTEDFEACVINTVITGASHYSEVLEILKANADVLGISAAITNDAAKYVQQYATESMTSLDAIAKLVNTAIEQTKSSSSSSGGSGGSSGGGSGSGSSGGSSGGSVAAGISGPILPVTAANTVDNASTAAQSFSDLGSVEWAAEAINSLCGSGVLNGYDDNIFRPLGSITREEFVKIIVTALGIDNSGSAAFTDVDSSRWSYPYIVKAVEAGIVNGYPDGSFAPEALVTRQDAAVMLYRAMKAKGIELSAAEPGFADSAEIADYAAEAVGALTAGGILTGRDDNRFAPLDNTNRAEAAVLVYRVIK